jgi:hypothetical protein
MTITETIQCTQPIILLYYKKKRVSMTISNFSLFTQKEVLEKMKIPQNRHSSFKKYPKSGEKSK